MRARRSVLAGMLAVWMGVASSLTLPASAQSGNTVNSNNNSPDLQARNLFVQGTAAYNHGDFAAALGFFQRAFQLSPRPALLFNIARCYERLNRPDDAIRMLQLLVSSPTADQTL